MGTVPIYLRVQETLRELAAADCPVLLTGESGTGKELAARAIHCGGRRLAEPFHAVNCAALPAELLEAELFGYCRGAFTGAHADKPGRFTLAGEGTLLLDEIGELPLALQAKLLRAVEERQFDMLGGKEPATLRARLLCSTNRDLAAMIARGTFRADLYYRLAVFTVHLPPLRERREDILPLLEHYLAEFSARDGRNGCRFAAETLSILQAYHYPGNVRELRNIVEHACLLCNGPEILPAHLPATVTAQPATAAADLSAAQRELLLALERCHYRRDLTARTLGIDRTTLWQRLKAIEKITGKPL